MAKPKNKPSNDFPDYFSSPAVRALVGAGYTSVEQLRHVSRRELAGLHGLGPKTLRQIEAELTKS